MYLRILIEMDNDAFGQDGYAAGAEVSRILRKYCDHLQGANEFDQSFRDFNGQTVGSAILVDDTNEVTPGPADFPDGPAVNSEDPAVYAVDLDKPSDGNAIIARAKQILMGRLLAPEAYVSCPQDMIDYATLKLTERKNEAFCVFWLDNRHGVIDFEELFQGTVDGATVPPRVVVQKAMEINAFAAVFVHNHPSGNPDPSHADKRITERLREALALVDVRVLDHIVIGGGDAVSMADRGMM